MSHHTIGDKKSKIMEMLPRVGTRRAASFGGVPALKRAFASQSVAFQGPRVQGGLLRTTITQNVSRFDTLIVNAGPSGAEEGNGSVFSEALSSSPVVDLKIGEDAAAFDINEQNKSSWVLFFGLLTGVLALIYVLWIDPNSGAGSSFTGLAESIAPTSEIAILEILFIFGVVHSGLAYLRPYGDEVIGARAYRVVFALVSLPLAIAAVVFFINHRYDGTALWNIRGIPGVHEAVWALSFISFYFLYPSTFNILEVAAVDEPKLHLWESGIIRITRHPQAFGQLIWCIAHTAWIGSSFMLATSVGLMAHHAFACWHGDFRLKRKYGDTFEELKERTSIIPFAAILDGRQKLPDQYWKEFVRLPYLFLVPFCVGAYVCHPLMQQASYWLGW